MMRMSREQIEDRNRKVLKLYNQGLETKLIAERLGILAQHVRHIVYIERLKKKQETT
jgi:DNA-binding NarL/FixJ family response regulator